MSDSATGPDLVRRRPNLVGHAAETWRPPLFEQDSRPPSALRRFLDLQAGSIWADLRQILPQARGVVVDVGCGARPYRSLFSNQVTYIGIDTADAKSHFGYEAAEVRYFQGDSWPIANASSDLVLCTETMALILRLVLPQKRPAFVTLGCRLAGLAFVPLLFLLAALAKVSLRAPGGDDCLGYTALAIKGAA